MVASVIGLEILGDENLPERCMVLVRDMVTVSGGLGVKNLTIAVRAGCVIAILSVVEGLGVDELRGCCEGLARDFLWINGRYSGVRSTSEVSLAGVA